MSNAATFLNGAASQLTAIFDLATLRGMAKPKRTEDAILTGGQRATAAVVTAVPAAKPKPSALVDTRVIWCGDCLEQLKKPSLRDPHPDGKANKRSKCEPQAAGRGSQLTADSRRFLSAPGQLREAFQHEPFTAGARTRALDH